LIINSAAVPRQELEDLLLFSLWFYLNETPVFKLTVSARDAAILVNKENSRSIAAENDGQLDK